jgi:hypothetical protein
MSSLAAIASEKDLACPIHPPSPPTTTTKHRRKSYDKSSLHRSARLAQHNVLKSLGVIGKDGKLSENAIQDIVDHLKNLLPPDLLKWLMDLKGRAF